MIKEVLFKNEGDDGALDFIGPVWVVTDAGTEPYEQAVKADGTPRTFLGRPVPKWFTRSFAQDLAADEGAIFKDV